VYLLLLLSPADILALDEPSLELTVDFLHFWANNGEFTQCVIAHMENADVSSLGCGSKLQHAQQQVHATAAAAS
jgi:hypothetical protein